MARSILSVLCVLGKGCPFSRVQIALILRIIDSCRNRLHVADDAIKLLSRLRKHPRLKNAMKEWFDNHNRRVKVRLYDLSRLSKLIGLLHVPYRDRGQYKTIKINHRVTVGSGRTKSHGWVTIQQIQRDVSLQQQLLSRLDIDRKNANDRYAQTDRIFKAKSRCSKAHLGRKPNTCGHP